MHVQDFVQVKKGDLLLQIDDRIYRQRVHQAEAQLAMKIAALNNNLQQRKSAEAVIARKFTITVCKSWRDISSVALACSISALPWAALASAASRSRMESDPSAVRSFTRFKSAWVFS